MPVLAICPFGHLLSRPEPPQHGRPSWDRVTRLSQVSSFSRRACGAAAPGMTPDGGAVDWAKTEKPAAPSVGLAVLCGFGALRAGQASAGQASGQNSV